jgi:hypothetical protein
MSGIMDAAMQMANLIGESDDARTRNLPLDEIMVRRKKYFDKLLADGLISREEYAKSMDDGQEEKEVAHVWDR